MVLEDVVNGLAAFLLIPVVVLGFLFLLWVAFPSGRSAVSSIMRVTGHGFWVLAPYVGFLFAGSVVGTLSDEALFFTSLRVRAVLGVVLYLTCFYSLVALVKHRFKWRLGLVRFVAVSCCFVVFVDLGIGVFLVDDWIRASLAWGLSVFLAWVFLYERDTLKGLLNARSLRRKPEGRERPHHDPSEAGSLKRRDGYEASASSSSDISEPSTGVSKSNAVEPVQPKLRDNYPTQEERVDSEGDSDGVGSVEIVSVSESYFSGKLSEGNQGDVSAVLEGENASSFRGFLTSLMASGDTFAFKQVFRSGQGRFFIQCKAQEPMRIRRVLRNVDAELHSWFPDFETRIHFGEVDLGESSGRWAGGWVSNLPAPSRNPMRRVAELFIHGGLTGCVTVIAKSSTSYLSSFSNKMRYRRLVEKARREEQKHPFVDVDSKGSTRSKRSYDSEKELVYVIDELQRLDSKLQAKCWVTVECENPTFEEAEEDLDVVSRTLVAAFTHEEKHHSLRWGKFPRRQCVVVHGLTSKLVPRGPSTVLLPSDLALYFWLPEIDTVARVKRKPEFLAPAREEASRGEIVLGRIVRHGVPSNEVFRLIVSDLLRHILNVGSTGSGKTVTNWNIVLALWRLGIPSLILDPVKKENRCLIGAVPGLRVFTVGDETTAPLRFNILKVPEGVKPQKHVDRVLDALCASIVMYPPAPYVLQMALNEAFARNGWDLEHGGRGRDVCFGDLERCVEDIVRRKGYEGEVRSTIIAALSTRFESLSQGGKGAALCSSVSMPPKEFISHPTVVELGEIGSEEDRAIVILMIVLSVYEYLQTLGPTSVPRCAIVIEEAGALFGRVEGKGGAEYDSKEARRKMVEVVSRLAAEIRALGAIMVFVNQSAVSLPLEITENTSTKIIHQVADDVDAGKVARMLGLNEEQKRALTSLEVGRPVIKTPGVSHPFQVEVTPVTEYGVDPTEYVDDEKLRDHMRRTFFDSHPEYLEARKAVSRVPTQVPKTIPARVDEESVVAAIVRESGFLAQYAEALDISREEKNVKPVVHLFLAKAARYTMKLDEMKSTALKILLVVAHEYHGGAKLDAHLKIATDFRSELAKIDSWPVKSGSVGAT